MDFAAFSCLRPLMLVDALIDAAGEAWAPRASRWKTRSSSTAATTTASTARGSMPKGASAESASIASILRQSPPGYAAAGLWPRMAQEAALQAQPMLRRVEGPDSDCDGIHTCQADTAAGDGTSARFKQGTLPGFDLERLGLCYRTAWRLKHKRMQAMGV